LSEAPYTLIEQNAFSCEAQGSIATLKKIELPKNVIFILNKAFYH
jgi:hypothetical protein